MRSVGKSVLRKEGWGKVTGEAKYIDDLSFPGMLFGRTVRTTIPHGTLRSVQIDPAFDGVIVTHRDIPGKNVIALIEQDQPCLVESRIMHPEEPVALLAHADRDRLRDAEVTLEEVPRDAVLRIEEATAVFKEIAINKGDLEAGFAKADRVIEETYRCGHQEQLYIENNGVIAVPGDDGSIMVIGSLQCPYYVHKALRALLGLPDEKVRVVQATTGGGFGGKEEYPSMIAGHAALLALKAKRPVKIVYDRLEDLVATTKRHPGIIRHRTGVTRDGRLTAMDIEITLDGGAYVTLSPVVLSRSALHASGPYRCDAVRIRAKAVQTNTPPNGAFRGFGAPQSQFAVEVHMDRIARSLGIDRLELRRKNLIRLGDSTATGQVLRESASAAEVLTEAAKRLPRAGRAKGRMKRGVGYSVFFHGAGFTGSGEVKLASKAALELTPKGARILVASTEIGQGTQTMHAQIVADTLGMPYEAIEFAVPDTSRVPDSGPTVASRTCMVVGGILQRCAEEMKSKLNGLTPAQYLRKKGPLRVTRQYEKPQEILWDENNHRGDAYGAYAWGANAAEVEVDPDTCEVRLLRFVAVAEIGKAIHPILAEGQIEGGTVQGIGYALLEDIVMKNGRMANGQLTNYIIPTTLDTPPIETIILENPYSKGPFGAKGVGEVPMDGPPGAIVNAINDALGSDIDTIPATPERIHENLVHAQR